MKSLPQSSPLNRRLKYLALSFGIAFPLLAQTTASNKAEEKDKEVIVLPAFVVNDTKDTGYNAREALSGNKTRQALANLAGAYSVVTNDLLKDMGFKQSMPQAVKFVVPGITPFVHGDQFMVRGRRSGGGTDDGQNSVIFFADSIGIDSIEIAKGPQAVLYGQAAGIFGNVMRISKKPLPESQGRYELAYGSWDFRRATLDLTGPLTNGFSYRFVGAKQNSGNWLKNYLDNRKVGIGTIQWKNEKTTIRLLYEYQDNKQRTDINEFGTQGLVFNVDRRAGRREGYAPAWGHYQDVGNMARLNISHQFNADWQSRLSISRVTTFRDYIYLLGPAQDFAKNTFTQDYFNYYEYYVASAINFDNIGKFTIGKIPTQSNFGSSQTKFTPLNVTRNYITKYFTGVLDAPDYSKLLQPRTSEGATGNNYGSVTTATSTYLLQTVDAIPDKLILSAGGAYNKSVVVNPNTKATTTNQGAWVKRVGAVFKPVKNISVYYGYATMFSPSSVTTLDVNGNPLPVITGVGSEIGIKASLLNGRVTAVLDYYSLARTNISVFTGKVNSRGLGYYELVGDENSKGWEAEIHTQLTKNWQLVGVAWKGNSLDRFGAQFFNSLKTSAAFYTSYKFTDGSLKGLTVGGGTYAQGRRYFLPAAAAGYVQHNVFAAYKLAGYTFQVNIENLTNVDYVAGAWSQNTVSGGAPRTFVWQLSRDF